MQSIIDQCYEKSVELLKKNSTKHGILASSSSVRAIERNYLSIFGRDASICALGMIRSGEKELVKIAKNSLTTLGKNQARNGQIPNFVKPQDDIVDFWHLGTTDVTLWWLLAIHGLKEKGEKSFVEKHSKRIKKAISFLEAWEHPAFNLLVQTEASDWADNMPRSGYVLYTNSLWCQVKEIYNLSGKDKTKEYFNYLFDPNKKVPKNLLKKNPRFVHFIEKAKRDKKNNALVSFAKRYASGNEVDVYANCLAIIFDTVSRKRGIEILSFILNKKANKPFSVKTVLRPITKKSSEWSKFMEDHNQNLPHKYHNGGVWPYISAFWVVALHKAGMEEEARQELERLAELNKKGNWAFNEWFHGKSGRAMGKAGQSWNAAMFIYALEALNGKPSK